MTMTHTIDCQDIPDSQAMHHALARVLDFPAGYGCNLDALHDALTDLREDVSLVLTGVDARPFFRGFRRVMEDSALENPHFQVVFL